MHVFGSTLLLRDDKIVTEATCNVIISALLGCSGETIATASVNGAIFFALAPVTLLPPTTLLVRDNGVANIVPMLAVDWARRQAVIEAMGLIVARLPHSAIDAVLTTLSPLIVAPIPFDVAAAILVAVAMAGLTETHRIPPLLQCQLALCVLGAAVTIFSDQCAVPMVAAMIVRLLASSALLADVFFSECCRIFGAKPLGATETTQLYHVAGGLLAVVRLLGGHRPPALSRLAAVLTIIVHDGGGLKICAEELLSEVALAAY